MMAPDKTRGRHAAYALTGSVIAEAENYPSWLCAALAAAVTSRCRERT